MEGLAGGSVLCISLKLLRTAVVDGRLSGRAVLVEYSLSDIAEVRLTSSKQRKQISLNICQANLQIILPTDAVT